MKNKLIDNVVKFIASFFGIGFFPIIPGTFGSIGGAVIYYLLVGQELIFYAVLFFLTVIGFGVSGKVEAISGKKDPKFIVIDEVVGIMISFILVPFSLINFIIVFVLFRIIDVAKPFPIRRLEKMPAGFGIMLDDIIAGLYTNIILQIGLSLASYKLV